MNGREIEESEVGLGLTRIRDLVADWETHPTFFEITTALALQHFQRSRCEVLVLETGMGGRLDATNAVPSSVSVLTPIDFDHEKWLGHSVEKIAREKAGIIKPHVPVVCGPQLPEAEAVIRKRAADCEASLAFVTRPWNKTPIRLSGEHQKINASLAVAALHAAALKITDESIAAGLQGVKWPARFQRWNERIVIDGAHNPSGARTLARTWRDEFGFSRATVILAILRDKNASAIVQALAPIATRLFLPEIRSERAESPITLQRIAHGYDLETETFPSAGDALLRASQFPERILITGSLHFAGEAIATLGGEPTALEECAQ